MLKILKIKTIIICFVVFLTCVSCFKCNVYASQNDIYVSASSAVLYCVNTGEFIYEKNAQTQTPMASTTKIMTTLLALEQSAISNDIVTITKDMYAEGSSMYLEQGNQLRLSDLAVGMMTVSGNDASNAVALTIGKTFENFAEMMNKKAKLIGMQNTNFVTPSGLDDENHYSTACDMAMLMSYAMNNNAFAKITSKKSIKVNFINPQDKVITYENHNKLLSLYKYCNGGKTGYTTTAGRCLVSSANKNGVKFIAVTLDAPNDWDDHIKMYDYGFSKFTSVKFDDTAYNVKLSVVGGEKANISIGAYTPTQVVTKKENEGKVTRSVELEKFIYAPIEMGQVVGKVTYTIDGEIVATNDLVANETVEYKEIERSFLENIFEFLKNLIY